MIKRIIKKVVKKRRKKKNRKKKQHIQTARNDKKARNYKIWLSILPNYVLSRKSKNSRMGKGKGAFVRWIIKIQQGVVLCEFLGLSQYRLKKILIKINKKLKLNLCLVSNKLLNHNSIVWSKLNLSIELFNKYRTM